MADHYKAATAELLAAEIPAALADANQLPDADDQKQIAAADRPGTPDAGDSSPATTACLPNPDSMVDLQKLQELEQRVRSRVQLSSSAAVHATGLLCHSLPACALQLFYTEMFQQLANTS
jgi:hypothetical protein